MKPNKSNNTHILIMAGGVGSRFWPKSRNHFPKQFIDILGTGKSLLQLTYERFAKLVPTSQIFILTNGQYAELVKVQLAVGDEQLLVEPNRNNTAPCIAYACAKIESINPEATIVVAPSDHLILKEDVFLEHIKEAAAFANKEDALITLGIQPTRPDTGYGYIKFNRNENPIKKVEAFLEKPKLELAQAYVSSGQYLWNAGIFIWSVKSIQKALKIHATSIFDLFAQGKAFYGTAEEKDFIANNYPLSENISIDYAVMEKADNVYTIPVNIGWSDLGTWASLHEVSKTENDNAINTDCCHLQDTTGCMISVNGNKAVVIKGLEDYIVVDDDKVLLIYPKNQEQEIKQVATQFTQKFGERYS